MLEKTLLCETITLYKVYNPVIAAKCEAGQFVVVRGDEQGERVPLTIADFDRQAGTITMVVQAVGVASSKFEKFDQGDRLLDIVGPLGHKSEIKNFGTVVCVGGGLGVAPVYPIQRALKEAGNNVISIMGARSKDLLFWEERMRSCADDLFITTDDGTYGEKGFVTTVLQRLIDAGQQIDRVLAIGPPVMMRAVAEVTRKPEIKTIVSLNSIMVDGTGMCGGCRVEVGDEVKFTCVDGPEFDGHLVNFDLMLSRLQTYRSEEEKALEIRAKVLKKSSTKAPHRMPMPAQDPISRRQNFDEVALGYTAEMAMAEAKRCLQCKKAPCIKGCPVEIDIPAFIKDIAEGKFLKAAHKLKEANQLPAICGRVCPQETQCEETCVLAKKGEPIAIGRLERFAADMEASLGKVRIPPVPEWNGKRVAIVGAGPAGLTAAGDLALRGYKITIFEALHAPGGVLVYGIPEFRLPKAIVQRESDFLAELGVDFRMNMPIGPSITVPELLEQGFDAVFIGTGAGLPWFMEMPGENLKGVYSSNEFLTRVNLMKAYKFPEYDTPVLCGKNVAVIGGGNVAMDSARSALRLGADNVYIVYRRTRKEMPARDEEIEHALEEGIIFKELTNPVRVLGNEEGWVIGMECIVMELGEPDDSGRRRPVPVEGSNHVIEIDQLIVAIGNGPNPMLTKNWPDLELDKRGNIKADENGATNIPGVFAGGDIVTGAATVIEAMGAGKIASEAIDKYIKGKK
ncbi:MAG: NADPH-dependent glutamate synthase [Planctomycetes bacterium]|nr:NADPH-dependent glutamate synthase [Planctomycetota bacterium]